VGVGTLTSDQIFFGLGLVLVLAVASQVVALRLRVPAIVVLLPVGFCAGALTTSVHPDALLGPAFQPLVSLAVAVILYDAGLSLDVRRPVGHRPRVILRLVTLGVPITWFAATAAAKPLLDLSWGAALTLGAILVVSGPTVVGPLLAFVRPTERVQRILAWEGTLIDPVGATLGALVFAAVAAGQRPGLVRGVLEFASGLLIGCVGAAIGFGVLWYLLRQLELGEVLGSTSQLAVTVAVAAGCDIVRDDSGLIAAIVLGLAVSNGPGFDVPARRPFLETLVQLIVGLLFISISATVTPASLRSVLAPTTVLALVLILVVRPLVAAVSTVRTELTWPEREFIGWLAPRGIVAAATASAFGSRLTADHIPGAQRILPATFLVVVLTVTVYGLTAAPVARALQVTRSATTRPLLVGGDPWVIDLACGLRDLGLDPLVWARTDAQRDGVRSAGLNLASRELLSTATAGGAELEGVTMVLLLTPDDDFNAVATTVLTDAVEGQIYRIGPSERGSVIAPDLDGNVIFDTTLSPAAINRRYDAGDRIMSVSTGPLPPESTLLFLVRSDGRLEPVTPRGRPASQPGDAAVVLTRSALTPEPT
jgi:NhaP-type Na+/H+ or K+/H+ antiporter